MNFKNSRSNPIPRVDLADLSIQDRAGAPDDKSERLTRLARISAEIDALQDCLSPGGSTSYLIVLQGMDTSGKDAHQFAVFFQAVDPLGVRA